MIRNLRNQRGISTVIIIAIVAVLSLGGVGAYVATDGFGTNKTEQASTDSAQDLPGQAEPQDQPAQSNIALVEKALQGDADVKCTYKQDDNSGTAYIESENKFRVDYDSPDGSGHLIYTSNTMYVWSDNETQGFKISNPKEKTEQFAEQYNEFSPENLKDNYSEENLNCETFSFNDDLVQLPPNVEFKSFDELFQNSAQ